MVASGVFMLLSLCSVCSFVISTPKIKVPILLYIWYYFFVLNHILISHLQTGIYIAQNEKKKKKLHYLAILLDRNINCFHHSMLPFFSCMASHTVQPIRACSIAEPTRHFQLPSIQSLACTT